MAKYIAAAPANGFSISEVTTGQSYPAEVDHFVNDPRNLELPRSRRLRLFGTV
jgi:hypothetical protein